MRNFTYEDLQILNSVGRMILSFNTQLTNFMSDEPLTINEFTNTYLLESAMAEFKKLDKNASQSEIKEVVESFQDALIADEELLGDNLHRNTSRIQTKNDLASPLYKAIQLLADAQPHEVNGLQPGDNPLNMIKILLEIGVNINDGIYNATTDNTLMLFSRPQSLSRRTPLEEAVRLNHIGVTKLLLDAGAHVRPEYEQTSLISTAVRHGNVEMTLALLEAYDKQHIKPDLEELLSLATLKGQIDIVNIMIKRGADLDKPYIDGKTPLIDAAKNANVDIVRILLNHGANINVQDDYGNTALHYAAIAGQDELRKAPQPSRTLSLAPALYKNVNAEELQKTAASSDHQLSKNPGDYLNIALFLIEAGANKDLTNNYDKRTPLAEAKYHENTDLQNTISNTNANPSVRPTYPLTNGSPPVRNDNGGSNSNNRGNWF